MRRVFYGIEITLILWINVAATPQIIDIGTPQNSIGLYEKFEAQISLAASYQNPFDPDDIDIQAVFTSPSGKEWRINAFYCYTDWRSLWMLRFSPDETGRWIFQLTVKDRTGETTGKPESFDVIPSDHHSPIQIAANKRYLEYSDGTSYYGVGLWYNDHYLRFNQGNVKPEELDRLKMLGVNFISSYMIPLETMGSGLGRYDQNQAGRLDELIEMCEERNILLSLNLWFHPYLSETVWPGGNRRWLTNPYQLICEAKDFYSSADAWKYQEKLYRYIIARWGYSRALAIWFIIDEVNGTDGWACGDSLGAAKWGQMVHDYFKMNDPYNHLTTGTRSGGYYEFWQEGYQVFDLAAREIYEAQGFPILEDGKIDNDDTHPLTLSYNNYANEVRKLWSNYGKPVIIGETGWDHTFYETSLPGYLAQYHNALWVCLATGSAMTPFWWAFSPYINDNVLSYQLKSVEQFVREVPFSELSNIQPVPVNLSDGDAFAMKSDQLIFGWVVNPKTDVTGATVTVNDIPKGDYVVKVYHTWRGDFIDEQKVSSRKKTLTFTLPTLKIEDGHARYIGQDAAFIIEPIK